MLQMLPILLHTRLVVTVNLVLTEYYYHCYYNHTPLHRVELQLVLGFEKGNGMVDAFVLFLCDGARSVFVPPPQHPPHHEIHAPRFRHDTHHRQALY